MSRVGKLPVEFGSNVKVNLNGSAIEVTGAMGSLKETFPSDVMIELIEGKLVVKTTNASIKARALWGLARSLIANMVKGVSVGFSKTLDITGVGFKAAMDGEILAMELGYSHDVKYIAPEGIKIVCPKATQIVISGINKQLVGQVAAEIRALRKPEPYKGKGIRYDNEVIRRKEGKKK
jgi:large subunit ribosomal protein L6